jgi:hypothetical protein
MNPIKFPQANTRFTAPEGMAESQVHTIEAFRGYVEKGSLDGVPVIVTAWLPNAQELSELMEGQPIFVSFVASGLPPHMLTTSFTNATSPN